MRSRSFGIAAPTKSVEVVDELDESGFRLPIAGHLALDAFRHPYAYAQSHEGGSGRVSQMTSAE